MQRCKATPQAADEAPADTEGIPEQLADMRWVYAHPAREDCTQGHKVCRKWLNADLPGFMARKSGLEAKVPPPKQHDDDYPIRLQLDERRMAPNCDHDEMVSFLIGVGTDKAFELYLTIDEWISIRDKARDAGLPVGDWLLGVLTAGAVATLAGLPCGYDLPLSASGCFPGPEGPNGFMS